LTVVEKGQIRKRFKSGVLFVLVPVTIKADKRYCTARRTTGDRPMAQLHTAIQTRGLSECTGVAISPRPWA
jgi:hypothetical protein